MKWSMMDYSQMSFHVHLYLDCLTVDDRLGEVDRRTLISGVTMHVHHPHWLPTDRRGRGHLQDKDKITANRNIDK